MKSQVPYCETQLSLFFNHPVVSDFDIMLYSESNPSVCKFIDSIALCTLSIRKLGHTNQKSNQINRLPLMVFGCFLSRDSQLPSKCSFCSIKIIFIPKLPTLVCRVMFRNPQERAVTAIFQIISIMSIETCQTFFVTNLQVVLKIYIR